MMEGPSLKKIIVSMLIVMMMVELTKAELHYVGGGKNRWATNVNFSEWTSHEQFNVGDWLCMLSLFFSFSFCLNCLIDEKVLGEKKVEIAF